MEQKIILRQLSDLRINQTIVRARSLLKWYLQLGKQTHKIAYPCTLYLLYIS